MAEQSALKWPPLCLLICSSILLAAAAVRRSRARKPMTTFHMVAQSSIQCNDERLAASARISSTRFAIYFFILISSGGESGGSSGESCFVDIGCWPHARQPAGSHAISSAAPIKGAGACRRAAPPVQRPRGWRFGRLSTSSGSQVAAAALRVLTSTLPASGPPTYLAAAALLVG